MLSVHAYKTPIAVSVKILAWTYIIFCIYTYNSSGLKISVAATVFYEKGGYKWSSNKEHSWNKCYVYCIKVNGNYTLIFWDLGLDKTRKWSVIILHTTYYMKWNDWFDFKEKR